MVQRMPDDPGAGFTPFVMSARVDIQILLCVMPLNAGEWSARGSIASGPAYWRYGRTCDNSLLAPEFHFKDEGVPMAFLL